MAVTETEPAAEEEQPQLSKEGLTEEAQELPEGATGGGLEWPIVLTDAGALNYL